MIPLTKSKEVQAAEAGNIPVVALESTIITHGLPWPKNLETALLVEETVRAAGAVPATIAVIGGVIHAGLDKPMLENLAKAENAAKLSRADLAPVIAKGGDGGRRQVGAAREGAAVFLCLQKPLVQSHG